jgi:magnesium chelatase family protein
VLALIQSSTLVGIDAVPVAVECSIAPGQLPALNIVGLPTAAVKEGAVRVKSALAAVDHEVPQHRVTVNLAPADLRKPGSALDLPTALSILLASELYDHAVLDDLLLLGELGLDGSVRSVPGVLASAMLAKERRMRGVVVPDACAAEALVVEDIEVYGVRHLRDVIAALAGEANLPPGRAASKPRTAAQLPDMADVRGQAHARAAIELAVAGGHNLLLCGPPGTGKSMLARRIPGVLPPMTRDESLETTKIYSSLGLTKRGLIEERPFRAPHHTISTAGLLGGGSTPHPGEISLAHHGVLFLDEVPEFPRAALEALRQPLEDRHVTIARVNGTLKLPASFMLVAAANPCPCGFYGFTNIRECTCGNGMVERYRSRLSGPLMDRIDLQVAAEPVSLDELRSSTDGESSAAIRVRVIEARARQAHRLARYGLRTNAEMTMRVLRESCPLDTACETTLASVVATRHWFSARGVDRILKVARTLADLEGRDRIAPADIRLANNYRTLDALADSLRTVADLDAIARAAHRASPEIRVPSFAHHSPRVSVPAPAPLSSPSPSPSPAPAPAPSPSPSPAPAPSPLSSPPPSPAPSPAPAPLSSPPRVPTRPSPPSSSPATPHLSCPPRSPS